MKKIKIFFFFLIISILLQAFSITVFAAGNTNISGNYLIVPMGSSAARIMIENNEPVTHIYTLQNNQLPEGFNGYFLADKKVIQTIECPPNSKKLIEFRLEAPEKISQDIVDINITLLCDDKTQTDIPLSFTVNKDYSVEIANNIKKLEIINGDSISLDIAIRNTGNKDLNDLAPSFTLPYKWILESVMPDKINLKPDETGMFTIKISVPASQASGNYEIKAKGVNSDVQSGETVIPVTVNTNINFAWWIIGTLIIAGIVTFLYFRKHGRR